MAVSVLRRLDTGEDVKRCALKRDAFRPCAYLLPLLCLLLSGPMAHARITPPDAVEAAARGPNIVRIFWNPVADAVKYIVYRDDAPIGTAGADAKEFVDTTAEAGRTYRYNVAAVDAGGAEARGRPYLERTFPLLPDETRCDLLVVGGNAAGVSAAVVAARYGLNVVLIEETRRLGGMAVNGLGASDIRRLEHASGFFEEFRRRVQSIYGTGNGLRYEPRVAQQALKEIIWSAPGLVVHRQVRPVKVVTQGARVTVVIAEELPWGRRVKFYPRFVVDATECADVAAWAGAPYRVGREPRSEREPHAGVIYYDRASDSRMPGSTGAGDKRVQAYSYLMIVKDYGPDADKTIPKPAGYDPAKYKGAPRWEHSWAISSGRLPNNKYEINQHPHGSDLQGVNYGYPTASYAERRRIEQLFKDHALGYLYYIQTVEGRKNIGLSEDDYRDSDGWPTLLYIREARRFEGEHMMDETDIMTARDIARANAIGIGDYAMDSHATQPAPDFDHYAKGPKHMGEGEFYLPQYTPWHQIPYHIMIPQRVENVFVPTAVTATHVAYGTYRMEPVRMHFGTAAGIAAMFCIRYNRTPRQIPVRQIQMELLKQLPGTADLLARDGVGAPGPSPQPTYLYLFSDVRPETPKFRAIQWLGARGFWPCPKPATRTPASLLAAAPFEPDASLPVEEAKRLLSILALRRQAEEGRKGEEEKRGKRSAAECGGRAGTGIRQAGGEEEKGKDRSPLTRGMAAQLLADFMGWRTPVGAERELAQRSVHYADLTPGSTVHAAAEALYAQHIDSRLWDYEGAFAPDNRLYFRPDAPLTRAQFAELLYLAHLHIGPQFEDHQADRSGVILLSNYQLAISN